MAKKTELFERHVALGGRMVEFAGWVLPVQYPTGPKEEHLRVRRTAGIFDIDHMGQVVVTGPDALPFLQQVMTADISAIPLGKAGYSLICYQDGGVVDDTFVYHLPDRYFVAINASNNTKDTRWFEHHRAQFQVNVENISDDTYMLALQGPLSQLILQPLCDCDLGGLAYHHAVDTRIAEVPTLVGHTGYTGEDGFELFFPANQARLVWDEIMSSGKPHGLLPIGLAARDSLRLEPCMPLYGQEISAKISPIEAGFKWAVSFDKGPFIGRDALLKVHLEGASQKLVAFQMVEPGVPRHGYEVVVADLVCGEVTSGIYSPTLDRFVGLAYVDAEVAGVGNDIGILIRDKVKTAKIVKKPFYVPAYRR